MTLGAGSIEGCGPGAEDPPGGGAWLSSCSAWGGCGPPGPADHGWPRGCRTRWPGVDTFRATDHEFQGLRFLTGETVLIAAGIGPEANLWEDPSPWEERLESHPLVPDRFGRPALSRDPDDHCGRTDPVGLVPRPTLEPVDRRPGPPLDPSRFPLDYPILRPGTMEGGWGGGSPGPASGSWPPRGGHPMEATSGAGCTRYARGPRASRSSGVSPVLFRMADLSTPPHPRRDGGASGRPGPRRRDGGPWRGSALRRPGHPGLGGGVVSRTGAHEDRLVAGLDIGTTRTCAVIGELSGGRVVRPTLRILGVGQAKSDRHSRRADHPHGGDHRPPSAPPWRRRSSWAGSGGPGLRRDRRRPRPLLDSSGVVAVQDDEITRGDVPGSTRSPGPWRSPRTPRCSTPSRRSTVVDHQGGIKDPVGMSGTRLETEVHLVTCSASAADDIRKAVTRAGYGVQELVLEPLAAARAVLTEDEKEVGVAMIEIGGGTTDVAAYYEGKIQHVAILPIGGTTLTPGSRSRGSRIPYHEARKAKETFGAASPQFVDPRGRSRSPAPAPGQTRPVPGSSSPTSLEQRLDELFGMVQQELDEQGLTERLGAGIVLTGGTAAIPGTWSWRSRSSRARRFGVPRRGSRAGWPTPWPARASPPPRGWRSGAATALPRPGRVAPPWPRASVPGGRLGQGVLLMMCLPLDPRGDATGLTRRK